MFKFSVGNIWSGAKAVTGLAVLTNPTELAFKKGNLKSHYPVNVFGRSFVDAEHAYWSGRKWIPRKDLLGLEIMMAEIIQAKFYQYPELQKIVGLSGGISFLEKCSHHVNNGRWEGAGRKSAFIRALIVGFEASFSKRM